MFVGMCLLAASCRKNECRDNTPYLQLNGFNSAELAGMVKKRYKRSPDFLGYLSTDSSRLSPSYSPNSGSGGRWSVATDLLALDAAYNYIIEVPMAGKEYRIRDIYFESRTEKARGVTSEIDRCCNTAYFTVNDSLYSIAPPNESERFQIILFR